MATTKVLFTSSRKARYEVNMKSLILVVLALALTSCLQPESSSVETARQAAPAIVEEIETGIDGTYIYTQVVCKNAALTTTKWQGLLKSKDVITINGSSFTAQVGFRLSDSYFDIVGDVDISESEITFKNMETVAITNPAWTTFADYEYGLVSYPQEAGFIDVGVGVNYPNVTYDSFEFDENRNLIVELPSAAFKSHAWYSFNASDRCFMIYERQ